jgi:hypothetical protein
MVKAGTFYSLLPPLLWPDVFAPTRKKQEEEGGGNPDEGLANMRSLLYQSHGLGGFEHI